MASPQKCWQKCVLSLGGMEPHMVSLNPRLTKVPGECCSARLVGARFPLLLSPPSPAPPLVSWGTARRLLLDGCSVPIWFVPSALSLTVPSLLSWGPLGVTAAQQEEPCRAQRPLKGTDLI